MSFLTFSSPISGEKSRVTKGNYVKILAVDDDGGVRDALRQIFKKDYRSSWQQRRGRKEKVQSEEPD